MRLALEMAHRGLLAGEPPIGACLVKDGEAIIKSNNGVIGDLDITAHAEIRAIRSACRDLRTLKLNGCRLFVTVEPCAMCLAACHYAGISEVVFGAGIDDLQTLTGDELPSARETWSGIAVSGGCLGDECRNLLEDWSSRFVRNA